MYSDLDAKDLLKMLIPKTGLNMKKLANILEEQTGRRHVESTFRGKINSNNVKYNDMREILKVLGYKIEIIKDEK